MADIKFEVVEHIGVLSESAKGWKKELNRISWNGNAPKYDIREWAPNREKMGKGVTLSEDEFKALQGLIKQIQKDIKAYQVQILVCFYFFMRKESDFSRVDVKNIVLFLAKWHIFLLVVSWSI